MLHKTPARRNTRHPSPNFEPLEARLLLSSVGPGTPAAIVAQADNAFAFDLLPKLAPDSSGNLFFSPYSIATALEMTLQGANADTASQIIQALHLPASSIAQAGIQALYQFSQADPTTSGYTLSTANRLWVNDNFALLQSFINTSQDLFGAAAQSVAFSNPQAAADTINAWVSAQTHGKITDLIPPDSISPFTQLILANAIYFKANWDSPFPAYTTRETAFQVSPTQTSTVEMMNQTSYFTYTSQSGPNGYQALDLPYQGDTLDMLVILPTASTLSNFQFTSDLYAQITSHLTSIPNVDVSLPRFKLEESYDIVGPLLSLGITDAFTSQADFSGIASTGLNISDVFHKSFIQVDESGTEAAAATGIGMTMGASISPPPPPPIIFNANHPFLFAIRDRSTNTILFLGQVTDPGNDTVDTPPNDTPLPRPPTPPIVPTYGPLALQPPQPLPAHFMPGPIRPSTLQRAGLHVYQFITPFLLHLPAPLPADFIAGPVQPSSAVVYIQLSSNPALSLNLTQIIPTATSPTTTADDTSSTPSDLLGSLATDNLLTTLPTGS